LTDIGILSKYLSMTILAVLALVPVILLIGLLVQYSHRIFSVLAGRSDVELTFSPHNLRPGEVFLATFILLLKPFFHKPYVPVFGRSRTKIERSILTLSAPFQITKEDISRFHDAVDSPNISAPEIPPPMMPIFLAALTEPAILLLLAHPRCPIYALRAINICNQFFIIRPDLCTLSILMTNQARLVACFPDRPRVVKRGLQGIEYELEASIMVPDPGALDSTSIMIPVFRQTSAFLMKRTTTTVTMPKSTEYISDPREPRHVISFSANDPRKWSALCKNYNPAHFVGFAAKIFGFPGRLAHGNHVVAKAMQRLMTVESNLNPMPQLAQGPCWMAVRFARPVAISDETLDVEVETMVYDVYFFSVKKDGRSCVSAEFGELNYDAKSIMEE
jgi:acyl dehydratase